MEESCVGEQWPDSSTPALLSHWLPAAGVEVAYGMPPAADPRGTAAGGCWLMTVLAAGPLLEEELYSVAAMWVSFRVLSSEET